MDENNVNVQFMTLVMMFATACWQHLGKTPNPVTGKTEKDISHAQFTIDLLVMLQQKTKGNLTAEEERLLSNTLADLQLNFADEANKAAAESKPDQPAEQKTAEPVK